MEGSGQSQERPGQSKERPLQIAVVGSSYADGELAALAEAVGAGLARRGAVVVCGGLGGVMEAAARGAAGAGGQVIGIVPGDDPAAVNEHATHVVATATGYARNLAVVASAGAVVAVGGEWGTLSEIALARNMGRPVVALRSWRVSGYGEMSEGPGIARAGDPKEAVALALHLAADGEGSGPQRG